MKFLPLFLIAFALLFSSCDPKVNERQARFDPQDCPTCTDGICRTCGGNEKCSQCDGDSIRGTSTENYTGEGVELVTFQDSCAFCEATGVCAHCEGTGKCFQCDGEGNVENWEQSIDN